MKKGPVNAPVCPKWYKPCGKNFLKPLIDIIKPNIIITLGPEAFNTIRHIALNEKDKKEKDNGKNSIYNLEDKIYLMKEAHSLGPLEWKNMYLFPEYHPAVRPVNRTFPQQVEDWKRIRDFITDKFPYILNSKM